MWEKIKKFFKWIADHTGISWIARKISSGWKWLFGGKANATQQNTSQQEKSSGNERQEPAQVNDQSKDHTTPKTPVPSGSTPTAEPEGLETPSDDSSVNQSTPLPYEPLKTTTQEPAQPTLDEKSQKSVVNKRKEGELKLNTALNGIDLSLKQALVVQDYKSHNVNANELFTKLLIYIKCGKDEYLVDGSTLGNPISIFNVPIVSIIKKNENGEYLDSNIKYLVNKDVKEMLGLKDDVTTVKVDSISNRAFEAPTLEQPKPNTTTTQQTVNNNSNGEATAEIKQASSSTTAGLTEQLPEVNSTQELSTPNNEPVKIDTPDQPKSPAAPDELRETLVNAHKKKGEPNNAASNGEVQPGVSNVEVDEEVKNLMVDSVDEVLAQDSGKTEEIPNSEKSKRESSTINVFNGNLELRLADDIQQKLEDYKHPKNNGKYRMEIHCKEDKFNITFNKMDNADGSLIINTLEKTDDKQVLSDTSKIEKSLGLKKRLTSVAIGFICKYQSVESLKLKVPTNNGVPSSETTSPEAEQHTVDTDLSVNA